MPQVIAMSARIAWRRWSAAAVLPPGHVLGQPQKLQMIVTRTERKSGRHAVGSATTPAFIGNGMKEILLPDLFSLIDNRGLDRLYANAVQFGM